LVQTALADLNLGGATDTPNRCHWHVRESVVGADGHLTESAGTEGGVADGSAVTVRSAHGELTGVATLTTDIRRGAVLVPQGDMEANVNLLTDADGIDPVTAWCATPAYR
jgi:predicted molibdopterin-dependent oxidoreductase YjgC